MLITADYASVEQGTGKLNILGAFTRILARDFPARHRRMAVVVQIRPELGDSQDVYVVTAVNLVNKLLRLRENEDTV